MHDLAGKISSLMCRIDRVEQENATLKEETAGTVVRVRGLESGIGIPPFSFVVDNFRRRQALAEDCLSPPFYSHLHGYRMRIRVSPNGLVISEGTHISLTVHLNERSF